MPQGFRFVNCLRRDDPYHGGLIIYFRDRFKHKKIALPKLLTFEAIVAILTVPLSGLELIIQGISLPRVHSVKFLRIVILSDLKWNEHIDMIVHRLYRAVGILFRVRDSWIIRGPKLWNDLAMDGQTHLSLKRFKLCAKDAAQEWFKLHHGSLVTVEELNVKGMNANIGKINAWLIGRTELA
ncbi:hypothetical protein HELRODRAFT_166859 [Helobdella robusta]|uniref:Uncharacterized protein n=1 Tax=Helobdella robusta TaxID=6412 RepID=T1EYN3_HELRO|nr:hypothetical protein HELRODRAFT_166859 [Helobdella robusta]ESO11811.1 hypothetical protein HELRODRAFT_166859 [Helobdella robusta]